MELRYLSRPLNTFGQKTRSSNATILFPHLKLSNVLVNKLFKANTLQKHFPKISRVSNLQNII